MSHKPVMRTIESNLWKRKLELRAKINHEHDVIDAERALMQKIKELLPDE
jgi:hypothetical protein